MEINTWNTENPLLRHPENPQQVYKGSIKQHTFEGGLDPFHHCQEIDSLIKNCHDNARVLKTNPFESIQTKKKT